MGMGWGGEGSGGGGGGGGVGGVGGGGGGRTWGGEGGEGLTGGQKSPTKAVRAPSFKFPSDRTPWSLGQTKRDAWPEPTAIDGERKLALASIDQRLRICAHDNGMSSDH